MDNWKEALQQKITEMDGLLEVPELELSSKWRLVESGLERKKNKYFIWLGTASTAAAVLVFLLWNVGLQKVDSIEKNVISKSNSYLNDHSAVFSKESAHVSFSKISKPSINTNKATQDTVVLPFQMFEKEETMKAKVKEYELVVSENKIIKPRMLSRSNKKQRKVGNLVIQQDSLLAKESIKKDARIIVDLDNRNKTTLNNKNESSIIKF